ncbi:LCP family protein [Pseudonocardia sp. H11422]|uniref:LCP family glycopolymer transferase n=1 Tax=Pseudonocardia sp. H11422 TaxID=2835866 RepID=UPI0029301EA2|nr:LCP family protein [Pseudonocardia sp. H11422]
MEPAVDVDDSRSADRGPRRAAPPPPHPHEQQPWPRRAEREQVRRATPEQPRRLHPAGARHERPAARGTEPPWERHAERVERTAAPGDGRRPVDPGGPPRDRGQPRDPARAGERRPPQRGAPERLPGGDPQRPENLRRDTPPRDTPRGETPGRGTPVRNAPARDMPGRDAPGRQMPGRGTRPAVPPPHPGRSRDDRRPDDRRPGDRATTRRSEPPARPGAPDGSVELTQPVAPSRGRADAPADPETAQSSERRPASRTPPAAGRRRPPVKGGASRRRRLGQALGITAAATALPGLGHLILRRRRTGAAILGLFGLGIVALVVAGLTTDRNELLETVLSTRFLGAAAVVSLLAAVGWIAVIVRTYVLARPKRLSTGRRVLGAGVVTALCLTIAIPFGFAAELANSQRNLLNALFKGGGTSAADAFNQPRLNVLLLGTDAGPDRTGTRTDTMMVASIDTRSAKTILFSLPRNIQRAQFPPDSAMAEEFPDGFHDPSDPLSGNYLLNAVYAYAHDFPAVAPSGPTPDPGINLLSSTISYMLGLPLDYYLEVDMAGFSSMIDAVGGVTVDVGSTPIPIGGVTADGRHVKPTGYIEPGRQELNGEEALWYARSRRDSTDYDRMGRQRCLIQAVLHQQSPANLLTNFQSVAAVATDNVVTNLPQDVLPRLVSLFGDGGVNLQSVAFDPSLPDPGQRDGHFNTGRPDPDYMREVVSAAIEGRPLVTTPTTTTSPPRATARRAAIPTAPPTTTPPPPSTAPASLADACAPAPTAD